ncbi:MAG: DNA repair protein RecN (Recombination protein N) [Candidatus Azotimanducaceae bacterium]|jgi:DNA repair protein RecN (Recombination protein N)
MLTALSINNYALIEELNVKFDKDFSIITGETGAGKSILLGALGLVLGKRADVTFLKNKEQKCIIEVEFNIEGYQLNSFFANEDLDYEKLTIIRREILPNGKSRAFINDTPTTLSVLNLLGEKLVDIHSQHQTLELANKKFQFKIIDALASNEKLLVSYKEEHSIFTTLQQELSQLIDSQQESKEQYDYNLHLFNELESADFKEGEKETIEQELDKLNNVEEIKLNLNESIQIFDNEEVGLDSLLKLYKSKLSKIATFSPLYNELESRIGSIEIELKDISDEITRANETVSFDPVELEKLNDRLQLIYDVLKKHSVASISELLNIQESLSDKVYAVENASVAISEKRSQIEKAVITLNTTAKKIHVNRKAVIPTFIEKLERLLKGLGMENTRFQINLTPSESFLNNGKDDLELLFSANKGTSFGELKKIASGGELSRIMLSVKFILSKYINLPTIIFDEIDTGVSGEISNKMGEIMQLMSTQMQVISITHLPQIAAKGNHHYKVYKEEMNGVIETQLRLLSQEERITELAEMLGGKKLSDSAIAHARELLN